MLEVDVAVVEAANGDDASGFVIAVIADELSHGPRLQSGAMLAKSREVADQHPNQLALGFPEVREQFAFFLGSQEVRREDGGRRRRGRLFGHGLALRRRVFMAFFPYI